MSSNMHNVMITAIIAFAIVLFVSSIGFFVHIDHVHGDNVKIECIKSGKDWVINSKSDSDSPKYECVTAGQ